MSPSQALASGAEASGIVLTVLFATSVAPAVFRLTPPDSAGRVFGRLARIHLFGALFAAILACAARTRLGATGLSLIDGLACAVVGGTLFALGKFENSRDLAMREPGQGTATDGPAILLSHQLLRGVRALAFLAGVLLSLSFLLPLILPHLQAAA
ncbi:MAG: hypothetical protein HY286_01535 [Planctomycetes bacterium]|nr:hypothetical protein [Planctomycetota bacterium]